MVMAMKVATGIEEEQYADGERNAPEERIAAMQVSESKPKKSKKKSRSRSR